VSNSNKNNLARLFVWFIPISLIFLSLVIARKRASLKVDFGPFASTQATWSKGIWVSTGSDDLTKRLDQSLDGLTEWPSLSLEEGKAARGTLHKMISAFGKASFEDWVQFCANSSAYSFQSDLAAQYFSKDELDSNSWSKQPENVRMELYFDKLLGSGANRWVEINLSGFEVKKRAFANYNEFERCDDDRKYGNSYGMCASSPNYLILHSKYLEEMRLHATEPSVIKCLIIGIIVKPSPNDKAEAITSKWIWNATSKEWIPCSLIQNITSPSHRQLPF
jgi:hypothetical protein